MAADPGTDDGRAAASVRLRGRRLTEPPGQFSYRSTKDGRVLVTFHGRLVVTVAGRAGERLAAELGEAASDSAEVQLLLARATGNFKRGNERQVGRRGG